MPDDFFTLDDQSNILEAIQRREAQIALWEQDIVAAQQRRELLQRGQARPRAYTREGGLQKESNRDAVKELDSFCFTLELKIIGLRRELQQLRLRLPMS